MGNEVDPINQRAEEGRIERITASRPVQWLLSLQLKTWKGFPVVEPIEAGWYVEGKSSDELMSELDAFEAAGASKDQL